MNCREPNQAADEEIRVLIDKTLYEFYGPKKEAPPELQIVFFHGVDRGNSGEAYLEAWKSSDGSTLWPKSWLAEKFEKARILSVSYDSSVVRGTVMYRTAENLIERLWGMETHEGCPLVMVGKDLGCLLIQAICVQAVSRRTTTSRMTTFLNNLRGFFFYCPPLMGLQEFPKSFDGDSLTNLSWGDEEISRLIWDFSKLRLEQKWKMKVMIASNRVEGQELVGYVPEASARFGADVFYSQADDIRSISRPQSNKSKSFTVLTDLISDCLTSKDPNVTSKVQSMTRISNDQIVKRMKFRLPFGEDPNYVPLEDTIEEIRSFLRKNRIVVLHGHAGAGKSSLVRYLGLQIQRESKEQGTDFSCFPEGVLFLPCGYRADVVSKQNQLLRMLNPLYHEQYKLELLTPSPQDLDTRYENRSKILAQDLGERLGPREALLILDDVWNSDILDGLVFPGSVKYLVTTQDPMLAHYFNDSKGPYFHDSQAIEIEPLRREAAHQILANFAGFDGGVIPDKLKAVAGKLVKKTKSNALSLATLGKVVESERDWLPKWQDLERRFSNLLNKEYYTPVLHGREYHASVLASMLLALGGLDADVKKLLYVIVLFEGPTIDQDLLRLFLRYMHWEGSLKSVNVSSSMKKLCELCLLEAWETQWPVASEPVTGATKVWKAWSIHSLRRHAIKTLKKKKIRKITEFLDESFQGRGDRSDMDLATSLCALYGENGHDGPQQRAVAKMGDHYIWTRHASAKRLYEHDFAKSLRFLIPMMLRKRNSCSSSKVSIFAEKIFWKVLRCELDGADILNLLSVPDCIRWTCSFLCFFNQSLLFNECRFSLKSLDDLVTKLLSLRSSEAVHEISPSNAPLEPGNNIDGFLYGAVQQLVIQFSKITIVDSLTDRALEEFKRVEQFVANVGPIIQPERAIIIRNLDFKPATLLTIPQFSQCLERIVGLLAAGVEPQTRAMAAVAIGQLAFIPGIVVIMQVPMCLEGLASLLAPIVEPRLQILALFVIARLARESANAVAIKQDSLCKERLDSLLTANESLVRSLAESVRDCLDCESGNTTAQVPSCLERLMGTTSLAEDVEPGHSEELVGEIVADEMAPGNRELALAVIFTLSRISENRMLVERLPVYMGRLVTLLATDVDPRFQKIAALVIDDLARESRKSVIDAEILSSLRPLVDSFMDRNSHKLAKSALQSLGECDPSQGGVEVVGEIRKVLPSSITSIRGEICRLVVQAGGPKEVLAELFSKWSAADTDRENFELAIIAIDKAFELDKNNRFLLVQRAMIRKRMYDLEGALEDLDKGLDVCPDDFRILKYRGQVRSILASSNDGFSPDSSRN